MRRWAAYGTAGGVAPVQTALLTSATSSGSIRTQDSASICSECCDGQTGPQGSTAAPMSPTVDIHHHVIPDFYWEASNEGGTAAGGINPPQWSLDGTIAYLDVARIDVAVLSISAPGVHFGDDAAARALARRCNEYLAGCRREHPQRFGGLA